MDFLRFGIVFIKQICVSGRVSRDTDGEAGAVTLLALQLKRATVPFNTALDDDQTQSRTGYVLDISAAIKGFENLRLLRFGNANSVILHLKNDLVRFSGRF